ncbi:MAG: M48 family peptidase, partial [Bacteroidota bacterium]|nr:M48 family peptidase [Bacteroidota bacterium]
MAGIIFYLIVAIVVFDFILERTLDYLNTTRWSETLPKEVEGIYDEEKYRQSMQYEKVNYHFGILTSVFSFLLLSGMLLAGGFAWLDNWTVAISRNEIIRALVFFGILMWASDILTIPFQWYSTFHIEEKFGFNRTTVKTFILDKLKGWGISALIGGGLMSLIIWFWKTAGSSF